MSQISAVGCRLMNCHNVELTGDWITSGCLPFLLGHFLRKLIRARIKFDLYSGRSSSTVFARLLGAQRQPG